MFRTQHYNITLMLRKCYLELLSLLYEEPIRTTYKVRHEYVGLRVSQAQEQEVLLRTTAAHHRPGTGVLRSGFEFKVKSFRFRGWWLVALAALQPFLAI